MSRIAKKPLPIVKGAKVAVTGQHVAVDGPKGKLQFDAHPAVKLKLDGDSIVVDRVDDEKQSRALHGTTHRVIQNMMLGVTAGYTKVLEIQGVGYKVEAKGKGLLFYVGYANQIMKTPPEGVAFKVDSPTKVTITGIDKQKVGQFAAECRAVRKPEVYKGKGIRYEGEVVKLKPGKATTK